MGQPAARQSDQVTPIDTHIELVIAPPLATPPAASVLVPATSQDLMVACSQTVVILQKTATPLSSTWSGRFVGRNGGCGQHHIFEVEGHSRC